MNSAEVLADAFGRIQEAVHDAVDGLTPGDLAVRLNGQGNSIAWLIWHLSRIQDDHVADVAGTEQVWFSQGWADRFRVPFPAASTGYGHTSKDVAAVEADSEALLGYHDAVYEESVRFLRGLRDSDLNRVVDESWTPAVTLGVRLVSVITDDLQHVGQAAFIRGMLPGRR